MGGIKAKDVVETALGMLVAAVLIGGGKFAYDVSEEYKIKTNSNGDARGFLGALGSWGKDALDGTSIVHKTPWERAVTDVTNSIIQFQYDNNR